MKHFLGEITWNMDRTVLAELSWNPIFSWQTQDWWQGRKSCLKKTGRRGDLSRNCFASQIHPITWCGKNCNTLHKNCLCSWMKFHIWFVDIGGILLFFNLQFFGGFFWQAVKTGRSWDVMHLEPTLQPQEAASDGVFTAGRMARNYLCPECLRIKPSCSLQWPLRTSSTSCKQRHGCRGFWHSLGPCSLPDHNIAKHDDTRRNDSARFPET